MDTLEIIRKILNEKLDVDPELVTGESTFKSLKIDSLDLIEFICDFEEEADIELGDPEELETINDFIAYVNSL